MKKDEVDAMLSGMDLPKPENIIHQQELKIPLLRYRRSSIMGLWLIMPAIIFIITALIKYELLINSEVLDSIHHFFRSLDDNRFLTYLIPLIFVGLPLVAMILNFLAFCHFSYTRERKELLVTIKYRPFNIFVFLLSFAMLVYAFLPDALP